MNTAAHTPGPWFANRIADGGFEITDIPDCWESAVLCARNPWPDRSEESAANARLIAAAPELLAALSKLEGLADSSLDMRPEFRRAIADAHAAIHSATDVVPA